MWPLWLQRPWNGPVAPLLAAHVPGQAPQRRGVWDPAGDTEVPTRPLPHTPISHAPAPQAAFSAPRPPNLIPETPDHPSLWPSLLPWLRGEGPGWGGPACSFPEPGRGSLGVGPTYVRGEQVGQSLHRPGQRKPSDQEDREHQVRKQGREINGLKRPVISLLCIHS